MLACYLNVSTSTVEDLARCSQRKFWYYYIYNYLSVAVERTKGSCVWDTQSGDSQKCGMVEYSLPDLRRFDAMLCSGVSRGKANLNSQNKIQGEAFDARTKLGKVTSLALMLAP